MDNSTKHTPSPWAARGWRITGAVAAADYVATEAVKEAMPEVFVRTVGQAAEIGKAAVCTVYGLSAEEVEANAQLIAAAPEMLVVARDFDEAMTELGLHCECGQADCRTTRLRTAIAKATGSVA